MDKVSQNLFKPIDICLNLKFENSKYVEETGKDALMVLESEAYNVQKFKISQSKIFQSSVG